MFKFIGFNLLPSGKRIEGYGTHRLGMELFKEDWNTSFKLLGKGESQTAFAARSPILGAVKAYQMLESRQVTGDIALVTPEFMGD